MWTLKEKPGGCFIMLGMKWTALNYEASLLPNMTGLDWGMHTRTFRSQLSSYDTA